MLTHFLNNLVLAESNKCKRIGVKKFMLILNPKEYFVFLVSWAGQFSIWNLTETWQFILTNTPPGSPGAWNIPWKTYEIISYILHCTVFYREKFRKIFTVIKIQSGVRSLTMLILFFRCTYHARRWEIPLCIWRIFSWTDKTSWTLNRHEVNSFIKFFQFL